MGSVIIPTLKIRIWRVKELAQGDTVNEGGGLNPEPALNHCTTLLLAIYTASPTKQMNWGFASIAEPWQKSQMDNLSLAMF